MHDDRMRAQELLARADKILKAVDESYIIKERGKHPRPMPTFNHNEIELGRTLGVGGFGIVSEITAFDLEDHHEEAKKTEEGENGEAKIIVEMPNELYEDDDHYDIEKARGLMKSRCLRKGVTRYALKRLHDHMTELEKARGMIDLAVEAKYLSVVWHPNIVKMRGLATGNILHPDMFIVMDRLFGTLDQRIHHWRRRLKSHQGFCGIGKKQDVFDQVLKERMIVAYDLAAALMYLHENRLVYRDIKPENIGFDVRGDVKVFDFGLCKNLDPRLKAKEGEYGYRLTGRAGSLPYMAPEVAECKSYDTKCDVYSFSILLWELLSLKPAFNGCSADNFIDKVVIKGQRPALNKKWPPLCRLVMPEAWDRVPKNRPDMKRVAIMIRGDLNDISTDAAVRRRTQHMEDRSMHSVGDPDEA